MTDHLAVLEELARKWRGLADVSSVQSVKPDDFDEITREGFLWEAVAIRKCADDLTAAIALMRGQSEPVEWQVRLIGVKTGNVVYDWHRITKEQYDLAGGKPHQGTGLRCEYRVLHPSAPPAAKQERDDA